ncbi:hypothetical protein GCM10023323_42810 [Streptomyces thinghirensis]|uniref:Uncharacterized protein n=1 Tax=Streptomyces thinghirensis TaxID=551547 RepID=A0ABP9T9C4_9ACTN
MVDSQRPFPSLAHSTDRGTDHSADRGTDECLPRGARKHTPMAHETQCSADNYFVTLPNS